MLTGMFWYLTMVVPCSNHSWCLPGPEVLSYNCSCSPRTSERLEKMESVKLLCLTWFINPWFVLFWFCSCLKGCKSMLFLKKDLYYVTYKIYQNYNIIITIPTKCKNIFNEMENIIYFILCILLIGIISRDMQFSIKRLFFFKVSLRGWEKNLSKK